jgi:propionyl-CoA carboxylase beta chain
MDINGKYFKSYLEREEAFKKQYNAERIKKQHSKGKLTAHERIALLFDAGTFEEIDAYVTPLDLGVDFGKVEKSYGDGVVTGHGKIDGRLVFAFAQDFTIMGGSLGIVHARKIAKVQEMALKMGAPFIGINDSGGARIQEGIASLSGYAVIFNNIIQSSGIIPQISVVAARQLAVFLFTSLTDGPCDQSYKHMFGTGLNG